MGWGSLTLIGPWESTSIGKRGFFIYSRPRGAVGSAEGKKKREGQGHQGKGGKVV